jgi:hypothetical protein
VIYGSAPYSARVEEIETAYLASHRATVEEICEYLNTMADQRADYPVGIAIEIKKKFGVDK